MQGLLTLHITMCFLYNCMRSDSYYDLNSCSPPPLLACILMLYLSLQGPPSELSFAWASRHCSL